MTARTLTLTAVAAAALLGTALLTAAAQNTPQAFSGSVYDTTGGVLPQVGVTLEDANHQTRQATTDASGRFTFPSVVPGRYVLSTSLMGFRPLREEIELGQARDWNPAITLQVGSLLETVSVTDRRPAGSGPAPSTRLRVGGNIRVPMKLTDVKPVYPQSMRDSGMEGVVPLEAIIDRDGLVASVRVLSAQVHPALATAAMDAVRQWQFSPTLLNGDAVEVAMTVLVRFSLTN
jgi:TonB family protein